MLGRWRPAGRGIASGTGARGVGLARFLRSAGETEMRRRFELAGILFSEPPLRPHPDMDEWHFLEPVLSDGP
jgi:hypothetical protein